MSSQLSGRIVNCSVPPYSVIRVLLRCARQPPFKFQVDGNRVPISIPGVLLRVLGLQVFGTYGVRSTLPRIGIEVHTFALEARTGRGRKVHVQRANGLQWLGYMRIVQLFGCMHWKLVLDPG